MDRDLSGSDYVYVWADGIHLRIRLEQAKAAVLVVMGVRADGTKELIALADGYRESSEAWADLLRDCARRGMRAPVLAVGDGALGFWKALAEGVPATHSQRCWVHKTANVLDSLPKPARSQTRCSGHLPRRGRGPGPQGRRHVRPAVRGEVSQGRQEDHRRRGRAAGVLRLPSRALDPPTDDEPDRVDVRDRAATDEGNQGSWQRAAGLAMVFKLVESAQTRWRAVNAPHLVALVRAGAHVERGRLVERPKTAAA